MAKSRNPWLIYFVAFNALLAALITTSLVPASQLLTLSRGSFFLGLALPGHFFFFALLLYFPLALAARLLRSSKKLILPVAILYTLFLMTIFVNAKVFELYRFHLNGMVVSLITSGEATQILSLSAATWLSLLLGVTALFAAEIVMARIFFNYFESRHHAPRKLWLAAISIMLVGQTFHAYSDARGDRVVTSMLRYIPWAQPLTAKRKLRELGIQVAEENDSYIGGAAQSALNYPKNQLQCDAESASRLNVVVLVIDSLRYDVLNGDVMPNTAALRESSWVFEDHYSTGNATRFGIFGLFYGLPGSYWHSMLGEQKGSVLFDVLADQDYQLLINATASWSWPEFDRTVFASISDQIVSGKALQALNPQDTRHLDSIVTDDFVGKISRVNPDKPFFGVLFLDAPHSYTIDASAARPFQPALSYVNYLDLDNDYAPIEFLNMYRNSVHYNDALIGQVIDELQAQSLLEETVVIITGDHGQEFNDLLQNYWGHNGNFSKYQTQTAMLIRWPNDGANRIEYRTSHEDIVPTLMQRVLGCTNPIDDYSTGQNLYAADYQPKQLLLESWSRRALMTDDRYYVFGPSGDTQVLDIGYNELSNGDTDSEAILAAMQTMGAFLR